MLLPQHDRLFDVDLHHATLPAYADRLDQKPSVNLTILEKNWPSQKLISLIVLLFCFTYLLSETKLFILWLNFYVF